MFLIGANIDLRIASTRGGGTIVFQGRVSKSVTEVKLLFVFERTYVLFIHCMCEVIYIIALNYDK